MARSSRSDLCLFVGDSVSTDASSQTRNKKCLHSFSDTDPEGIVALFILVLEGTPFPAQVSWFNLVRASDIVCQPVHFCLTFLQSH